MLTPNVNLNNVPSHIRNTPAPLRQRAVVRYWPELADMNRSQLIAFAIVEDGKTADVAVSWAREMMAERQQEVSEQLKTWLEAKRLYQNAQWHGSVR